jgi:hypothetical protein
VVLLDFQGQTAPNLFPITLQVFAEPIAEGDVPLHTVTVEGSGVLEVPVAMFKGRKVVTITTFADGTVTESTATGLRYLAGPFTSRQERGGFRVVPLKAGVPDRR